jgi:hypothetical protein
MSALLYILATLAANYMADWFLNFGGMLVSVSTLVFGATFTLRDYLHHRGRKYVYTVISLAAVCNVLMSLVLGVEPRIILASFLAIVLAEAADTEVYQRHIKRSWLLRVATSNIVSIPLDTVTFTLVAFAGTGILAASELPALILGDTLLKFAIGALVALARYTPLVREQPASAVIIKQES